MGKNEPSLQESDDEELHRQLEFIDSPIKKWRKNKRTCTQANQQIEQINSQNANKQKKRQHENSLGQLAV